MSLPGLEVSNWHPACYSPPAPMDTRLLKMFSTVARKGSLVAAARELHLTPSAVSHGLKSLETQLGCRILDRVGKKVYLNQAGEQLLAQIEKPLAALAAAEESVKRLGKWGQSRLRIGASASACQYLLPRVIKKLKKNFENLSVIVETADTPELVEMLLQHKVDLGIGPAPAERTHLEVKPLFKDELLFTFSHQHPWAKAKSIQRESIAAQSFIFYQRHSLTSRLVEDFFRAERIAPVATMEIASIEAIKQLVRVNLGVSILAPWTAADEVRYGSLRMRPMGPKPLKREWALLSLAGRRLQLVEESFCKWCREAADGLMKTRDDLPY